MREIAYGVVWFSESKDAERVDQLMLDWCSCRRAAYQAIHKHKVKKLNDIIIYCKKNYRYLGQRFVVSAVTDVKGIKNKGALFGGKRLWEKLQTGTITKEQWRDARNNQLWARGDRSQKGNLGLRIVGDELWVNDPAKYGLWIKGKLWLNKPPDLTCYNVRIIRKNGKYEVKVSWETPDVSVPINIENGVVGIDANPDGLAVIETGKDGNLLHHRYLYNERIQFACKGKRQYDVRMLAVEIVEYARNINKPLVLEKLSFKKKDDKKKTWKKFRRMKSNFIYSQLLQAIKRRAQRQGVAIIDVNPAFTSIIGMLKYQQMYSLNRHTAAALVIARKGQGYKERVEVKVDSKGKRHLNLEGRSCQIALTKKAFSWMCKLYNVHSKSPRVTPSHLASNDGINDVVGQKMVAQSSGCEVMGSITGQIPHQVGT